MEKQPPKYFHGTLHVSIFHATSPKPSFPCNCILLGNESAYVTIAIGETRIAETRHRRDRVWNQNFRIHCAHHVSSSNVTITLRTRMLVLGTTLIPVRDLLTNEAHDGFASYPLLNRKGEPNTKLVLRFALRFRHAESEPGWGRGLAGFQGLVHGTTFTQRTNCSVTLYQDAHHGSRFQPPIVTRSARRPYRPRRLWEDVFKAIDEAKHLVYIVGWSLNPKMVLVRDPRTEIAQSLGVELGELLKRKADEGITVRLMLWDDESSLRIIKNKGVMQTHDEDAFSYFQHTRVICRLCPRLHHNLPTFFAHHQKTITVDAAGRNDIGREVISFIGGLDLCDGRYDTEDHSLFHTLDSHDFYQVNFANASIHRGGPREPWHDTHACIRGQAAIDVLSNFEQRWSKQCRSSLLPPIGDELLLRPQTKATDYNWNIQVFRSIDKASAEGLPNDISVEHSIHDAYVRAIRRAERFIYIENQYFIGGCHLWAEDQHSGCKNLIPVEIALKVASKIRAGERFAAYIVIPMWPEGVPESEPVQEMLHWSRLTMTMMYELIGKAIRDCGRKEHPRDYLNFFCLANREEKGCGEFEPPRSPPYMSQYWRAQKNRRFMIYVHSKLMIVDDEYMMIGSANVNQRSMDGERDTEIAIGCYELKNASSIRDGEVHAFRMSLWYEHTDRMMEVFTEPEGLHCVRSLQRIGEEMWDVYRGESVVDMRGVHLVSYPLSVSEDGIVNDLVEGRGTFPDTTAPIKGRRSTILPQACTT